MVARALTCAQEQIEEIELHAFGDASKNGVCATVHAVVRQPSGVSHSAIRTGVCAYGSKSYHKRKKRA